MTYKFTTQKLLKIQGKQQLALSLLTVL